MDNPFSAIWANFEAHKQEYAIGIAVVGLVVTVYIWRNSQANTTPSTPNTIDGSGTTNNVPDTSGYAGTPSVDANSAYDQLSLSITQLTNQIALMLNQLNKNKTPSPKGPPVKKPQPPVHIGLPPPVHGPIQPIFHRPTLTPNEHDDISGIQRAVQNYVHSRNNSVGYIQQHMGNSGPVTTTSSQPHTSPKTRATSRIVVKAE